MNNTLKYFLEGSSVAISAYYFTNKKTQLHSIITIGLVASVTFFILDIFAPSIASSTRLGSGFVIGNNLVGGYNADDDQDDDQFEDDQGRQST